MKQIRNMTAMWLHRTSVTPQSHSWPNQAGMSWRPLSSKMPTRVAAATGMRRYQRGWSKQMMKVSRYRLSVVIHSRGSGAMSWLTWSVVAMKASEGSAGSSTHATRCAVEVWGGVAGEEGVGGTASARGEAAASPACSVTAAHSKANTQNPIVHIRPIVGTSNRGSKTYGNDSRARNEPAFESA